MAWIPGGLGWRGGPGGKAKGSCSSWETKKVVLEWAEISAAVSSDTLGQV